MVACSHGRYCKDVEHVYRSSSCNQNRSSKGVAPVKDSLIANGKVDPIKIRAGGKGETDPVTQSEVCADKLDHYAARRSGSSRSYSFFTTA